jgi:hypothetical protein
VPLGAVLGCLLGSGGWAVGLLIVAAISGSVRDIAFVTFVGLLLSFSVTLPGVLAIPRAEDRTINDPRGLVFPALLLNALAVLSLYFNHALAPVIDQTPALRDLLERWHAPYRVHPWLVVLLLLGSLSLWTIVLLRLRKLAAVVDHIIDAV